MTDPLILGDPRHPGRVRRGVRMVRDHTGWIVAGVAVVALAAVGLAVLALAYFTR